MMVLNSKVVDFIAGMKIQKLFEFNGNDPEYIAGVDLGDQTIELRTHFLSNFAPKYRNINWKSQFPPTNDKVFRNL